MTYVYLMYDYEEHGPENLIATLDRGKIRELAIAQWGEDPEKEFAKYPHISLAEHTESARIMIDGIDKALSKTDEELEQYGAQFRDGWGWPGLQAVKLA